MAYQDDYVMRTITDLVRAIAGLALGKNEIDYDLPLSEAAYTPVDWAYRRLKDLADAGDINGAENELYECLDTSDRAYLEMALLDDDALYTANFSREEIAEGINSVSAQFGISGFENFVDTTMV